MSSIDGSKNTRSSMGRRDFLRTLATTTAGAAGITGVLGPFDLARAAIDPGERGIKITNMTVATIRGLNSTGRIVRLDTNKGISGYGECRVEDNNAANELNRVRSTIIGMNPTQVEKVFNAVTAVLNPTSDWKRITYASGAIAGIECACWDITGKVYNLPIWKLLGPKLRDKMRLYCDTWVELDPSTMEREIQMRLDMGFTWFKTDLNFLSSSDYQNSPDPNPYGESSGSAKRILDSGLNKWRDYTSKYRRIIGNIPLGADHFFNWSPSGSGNQLDVSSAIMVSNALAGKEYMDASLGGWMEDIIPWHYYSELAQINAGTEMSILTGEDIFGLPLAKELVDSGAINYFHPDPCTYGGVHVTRLAAMYAHSKGIRTAFHQSNGPIATIMCAHISAGIPDFLCCEHHYPEISWYDSLIEGIPKPMIQKDGYVLIPDGPGLGITLNQDAIVAHGTWFA